MMILHAIARDISNEEILCTMKSFRAFKALFYQSQWEVVGPSLCNLIKNIFAEPWRVADINKTFLTLIPKVDQISSMKHFRRIGFCNVSYKTIKLLAARIRPHLDVADDLLLFVDASED